MADGAVDVPRSLQARRTQGSERWEQRAWLAVLGMLRHAPAVAWQLGQVPG
jgi:hypothetical protein